MTDMGKPKTNTQTMNNLNLTRLRKKILNDTPYNFF